MCWAGIAGAAGRRGRRLIIEGWHQAAAADCVLFGGQLKFCGESVVVIVWGSVGVNREPQPNKAPPPHGRAAWERARVADERRERASRQRFGMRPMGHRTDTVVMPLEIGKWVTCPRPGAHSPHMHAPSGAHSRFRGGAWLVLVGGLGQSIQRRSWQPNNAEQQQARSL